MSLLEEKERELLALRRLIVRKNALIALQKAMLVGCIPLRRQWLQLARLGKDIISLRHEWPQLATRSKELVPFRRKYLYLARRGKEIMQPRIGNLNQYAPRTLTRISATATQRSGAINAPGISIVTPSFNQGAFIGRTIASVLQQGYSRLEYFVQDGGSADETQDVLKNCEESLSGWHSCPDGGQSHAINLGFARTGGEIMGWLNSDDLLLPGALARVADHFARHPEVDVVYGNRLLIDENDMEIGRWILPGHDSQALCWADYVPQETLFWRRSLWDKVGASVDESFRFAMDWDLLLRFREAGARFAHLPYFLGAFRVHSQQKTSAAIHSLGFQEMDRLRARTLGRVPDRTEICRALLPFMARHIAIDLTYRVKTRFAAQFTKLRAQPLIAS